MKLKVATTTIVLGVIVGSCCCWVYNGIRPMIDYDIANLFAEASFEYCCRHGSLPFDVDEFCREHARLHCRNSCAAAKSRASYIRDNFVIHRVSPWDVLAGKPYVTPRSNDSRKADAVNSRLKCLLVKHMDEGSATDLVGAGMCKEWTTTGSVMRCRGQSGTNGLVDMTASREIVLRLIEGKVRDASDRNQVMDALLNQPQMPSDYGETMIALCLDESQDVLTRDFAVQHIGLYAQALSRRGEYKADSPDAQSCRAALFDAASETRTVVAAAAFRALADMSGFDSCIDARRLDSLLANCAADPSSAPAARAMAVQLCGERRVNAARPALEAICADGLSPEILRRSASRSLAAINGH